MHVCIWVWTVHSVGVFTGPGKLKHAYLSMRARARGIWSQVDLNGDGLISYSEYIFFMTMLSLPPTRVKVHPHAATRALLLTMPAVPLACTYAHTHTHTHRWHLKCLIWTAMAIWIRRSLPP